MDRPLILISALLLNLHIVRLFATDQLTLYVHPRFVWFAFGMGILASVCLTAHLVRVVNRGLAPWRKPKPTSVAAVILCLCIVILPPQALSPQSVAQRTSGKMTDAYMLSCDEASQQIRDQALVSSWSIALAACHNDPLRHQGRTFTVQGFVHDMPLPDSITIARYLMGCCTIDATPYTLVFATSEPVYIPTGSWVEVTAEVKARYTDGTLVNYLELTHITTIDKPSAPYEYY